MAGPVPVTFDVNVFVAAVAAGHDDFRSWPSPPPLRGSYAANAVGVVNDARELALWLSPHILRNVMVVLTDEDSGFGWSADDAKEYLEIIVDIAYASGGGVVDPVEAVIDCPDHEDNRILECAAASDSLMVVSNDTDLAHMSPWRGIPIVHVSDFVRRVDVSRRRKKR